MPLSDPVDILLAHDRWATKQLLHACEGLSEARFHQPFEMGPGSLHATVAHIIGAMTRWGDTLARRAGKPAIDKDGIKRSPGELAVILDEIADDFANSVRSRPMDEKFSRELAGKSYSFTRGAVLTHVATHSMHHRAQCLNMLRQLGVRPLPLSSVMEFSRID